MMDGGLLSWEQWSRQWLAGEEKKKNRGRRQFFLEVAKSFEGEGFFFPEEDLRVNQGRSLRMNEWSSEEGEQRSKREVHGEKAREKLCLRREPPRYEHSVFFIFLLPYFLLYLHFLLFLAHTRCLNMGIIGYMFIAIVSLDCCALPI